MYPFLRVNPRNHSPSFPTKSATLETILPQRTSIDPPRENAASRKKTAKLPKIAQLYQYKPFERTLVGCTREERKQAASARHLRSLESVSLYSANLPTRAHACSMYERGKIDGGRRRNTHLLFRPLRCSPCRSGPGSSSSTSCPAAPCEWPRCWCAPRTRTLPPALLGRMCTGQFLRSSWASLRPSLDARATGLVLFLGCDFFFLGEESFMVRGFEMSMNEGTGFYLEAARSNH